MFVIFWCENFVDLVFEYMGFRIFEDIFCFIELVCDVFFFVEGDDNVVFGVLKY